MNKTDKNKQILENRFNMKLHDQSNKFWRIDEINNNLNNYLVPKNCGKKVNTKYGEKMVFNFDNSDMSFWFSLFNVIETEDYYLINDYNPKHTAELAKLIKGADQVFSFKAIQAQTTGKIGMTRGVCVNKKQISPLPTLYY